MCQSGECILRMAVCDDYGDCDLGEDERNCDCGEDEVHISPKMLLKINKIYLKFSLDAFEAANVSLQTLNVIEK